MAAKDKGESLTQIEKFRELARKLETDDDEARFAETVKRIVTAPRTPAKKPD